MIDAARAFIKHPDHRNAFLIFAGALLLYGATLEPSVAWGDGALYQYNAQRMILGATSLAHPLYILIARLFLAIPVGGEVLRVNMVSAVFGALAAAGIYLALKQLTHFRSSAVLASVALIFSHTFWFHAVIPEVYSLNAFFTAVLLYSGITYLLLREARLLRFYAFVTGVALTNHLLAVIALPPLLYLLFLPPLNKECEGGFCCPRPRLIGEVLFFLLIGYALYLYLAFRSGFSAAGFVGGLTGGGFFKYWSVLSVGLIKGLFRYLLFLFYQFPAAGFLLILFGAYALYSRSPRLFVWTLIWMLGNLFLVAGYSVKDQFAFYLPSYVVLAIWMGMGIDRLFTMITSVQEFKPLAVGILALALVMCPLITYSSAPWAVKNFSSLMTAIDVKEHGGDLPLLRTVPGRDDLVYYLWPPKNNQGARGPAEAMLAELPPNAVLLADWTVWAPLHYLQRIENRRPDVLLANLPRKEQLVFAGDHITERPVFIVTLEGAYYDVEGFTENYRIRPTEHLFQILPAGELNLMEGEK